MILSSWHETSHDQSHINPIVRPVSPRRKGGAASGALGLGIEDLGTWTSVKKDGSNGKNLWKFWKSMEIYGNIYGIHRIYLSKENEKSLEILWKWWI